MTLAGIGRAEAALLCVCARRSAQFSGIQGAVAADANVDWKALISAAEAHGVAELLYAPLATSTCQVPPEILADLERRVLEATGQGLNRTTQLVDVLQHLTDHGIRALAFKGSTLAVGAYGHLGRRVSNDIDIFIDRSDLAEIRPLLLAHGYRVRPPDPGRCESVLYGRFPSAGRVDELLPSQPWQAQLEVHVAFATWPYRIRCDAHALFDRAITVDVAGHNIPTLCPEDLLPALAIHGMMHSWWPLRLVSDIDAVADQVHNWDDVLRRAEAAGMRRILSVALLLAERLLGTTLPPDVFARASGDRGVRRIVDWASTRMFDAAADKISWPTRPWLRTFAPDTVPRRLSFYAMDFAYMFLKWPWNTRPAYHSREGSR